ncbi:DUF1501 domain-containing protein [Novipirellula artificiosorum]|uniref:DUF1501 domain-containing protein n=1 Tax=Novipirellula artificiosorum TaxID=2528016 RepID=A0A5C6D9R8_9BACT|nr:DUF1501 domain-containing protein [Novipirellula artificiosorum]TWU32501.1 hypothetical protein Poly41_54790 [Novipirellula artificiosorum]
MKHEPTSISRRGFLRSGLCSVPGLPLANHFCSSASAARSKTGTAKSVIQIWMWGGASHLDTFDPKPEAGSDYCGPFSKPIETNVPGIRICELLPELAKQADKYSIIRSMTHGINAHETGTYLVQTGRMPGDSVSYPSVGSVVSYFKGYRAGYQGMIPPYTVLTKRLGRFSEAGFLGQRYKPLVTGGDPAQDPFAVEGVVVEGISERRQKERRELMHNLDMLSKAMPRSPKLAALKKCENEAYSLILGDGAAVFDLAQESDELRESYGRNTFGQSCLAARRLVEQGVRFITINYEGWDTHKNNFTTLRQKLPEMDQAMATLLKDLSERGLLDSTIVWWSGEFGRTPKIQWEPPYNGGRGHWGSAFSALVAGGGFKGGQLVGSSDARGETVKDRPVYPCDLIGSIYQRLCINPLEKLPHPLGKTVHATPTAEEGVPMGGLLTEII